MKEERQFLFNQKRASGESSFEANDDIKKDRAYLKDLKLKSIKKKKPKLNFKLVFEELKNGKINADRNL